MTTAHIQGLTEAEAAGIQNFEKPAEGSWTEHFGLDTGPVDFSDSFSEEFFEYEKEAVFRRSWLNVGRVEELPRLGSYFTKELEFLGVSVLVIRGMDDQIRAFHNVCSHRGNKLVWDDFPSNESRGVCRQISCKYHGWRYDLDGQISYVHNAPEFFNLKADDLTLPKINLDVWAGFIFINLEKQPRQSLREFLTPGIEKLEDYPFDKFTQRYVMESEINSNWKLFLDAFQEVYHVPYVHGKIANPGVPATGVDKVPQMTPAFLRYGKHRVMCSGGQHANKSVRNTVPLERIFRGGLFGPQNVPDIGDRGQGVNAAGLQSWGLDSWQIYPNFVIITWAGNVVTTYHYWPISAAKHKFVFTDYFAPPASVRDRLAQHYTLVTVRELAIQDANTLEATQQAISSQARSRYYLNDQEVLVRHLHHTVVDDVEALKRERDGK